MKRAKVQRMQGVGAGPKYGRGWATKCYYINGFHYISGAFKVHPTHAAALAHALAETGLAKKEQS